MVRCVASQHLGTLLENIMQSLGMDDIGPLLNISDSDNNNTSSSTTQDDSNSNNLSNLLLEPQITARYPSTDYPDQPLNLRLPQFCFPEGTSELLTPITQYKMPRIHYFVLTDSGGGKLYGTALTVYEEFHNTLSLS